MGLTSGSSYCGEGYNFDIIENIKNENLIYDLNGNITMLTRYQNEIGLIDSLTYIYRNKNASNMLDIVNDAIASEMASPST